MQSEISIFFSLSTRSSLRRLAVFACLSGVVGLRRRMVAAGSLAVTGRRRQDLEVGRLVPVDGRAKTANLLLQRDEDLNDAVEGLLILGDDVQDVLDVLP